MELLPFQILASTQIADRFNIYMQEPLTTTRTRIVPFYQNLSALTGSGKTLILADAIEQIRSSLPIEPIVLWLSKGKVVVWQTYANLSTGKYAELLGGYKVKPLLDCSINDIEQSDSGLILVATVAKFNQKDKDKGNLKVFQIGLDSSDQSLWDMLKIRIDSRGMKRHLIVVYDEGHNLSDQQTVLLNDLEPDAIIAASATIRIPIALGKTIQRLRDDKDWKDDDFVTVVKSSDVVKTGLVKKHIMVGGYITPMEIALDDMLDDMKRVDNSASELGLTFHPKAIYVSNTNILPDGSVKDVVTIPFIDRQARPILIWRHLVENRGIAPEEIAVYCNLKFDPKFPPPLVFNLFSGGDSDYDNFISGNYKHIIFNIALQEGWDDPSCYFAYIDKRMGSKDQVVQVVGRVLRQPNAKHYTDISLNTAHFYIRTDEQKVIEEALDEIRKKIAADSPEISLSVYKGGSGGNAKPTIPPKRERFVPEFSINSVNAKQPIREIIEKVQDYRADSVNTVGKGKRINVLQTIGSGEDGNRQEWVEVEHSNRVTARWVFSREIHKYHAKAVNLCDIEVPKFDALIEYHSPAAEHMREAAKKVLDAYIEQSVVVQNNYNQFKVGDASIDRAQIVYYDNAIHDGYSGLNELEKSFAESLDKAKIDNTKSYWFRNPSKGFFEIPLLDNGGTEHFNPDFIVWAKNAIIAIDPKGDHLITEDAGRKLFYIDKVGKGPALKIRLVTQGKWRKDITKENNQGYTVWLLKHGKPFPIPCVTADEAVKECLKVELL